MWKQANPALGDFRSLDEMRTMCARAKEIPAQENTFRRLYLNQWTEQSARWIEMAAWDACQDAGRRPRRAARAARAMSGWTCSTTDLTALVAVFPDDEGFDVLPAVLRARPSASASASQRDRVPYDQWARDGLLTATPGNVVDYEAVRASCKAGRRNSTSGRSPSTRGTPPT